MAAYESRTPWFEVDPAFLHWKCFPRLVVAAACMVAVGEFFAFQASGADDASWVAASAEVGQLLCDRLADDIDRVERLADSGGE